MPLASNALTTLKTLKYELKLYNQVIVSNETLQDSGDHLTYSFSKKDIVPESVLNLTETVAQTTTNVDGLVESFDYENGKVTFSSTRTGTIKVGEYTYNKFDNTQDSILTRKINTFSDFMEKQLDRKLGKQDYDQYYPGTGRQMLVLDQSPIVGTPDIYINEVLLETTEYQIADRDKEAGIIFKPNGWSWEGYYSGIVGEPTAPKRNIRVQYTAGYVLPKDETEENPRTLPYDIEDLALQFIAEDYYKNGSQGLNSFSISDVKWQWSNELKQTYQMILNKYRRYAI